jgi:hypothetical protein
MKILPVNEKQETDSYPYGWLKTTAYFYIEFNFKKGFRHVFQTINPKNGKLNAPKNGTYNHLSYIELDEVGHFKQHRFNFYGYESYNEIMHFLDENHGLALSSEQIEYLCSLGYLCLKANARYVGERIFPLIDSQVKALVGGIKTKEINWADCFIDTQAINTLKDLKPLNNVTV